ncbi:MAG: radical SAM protein [bacterium]
MKTHWFINFLHYYYKTKILGKRYPLLAGYKITHKCNLKCGHCPFWKENRPQLTFSEIKTLFKKLHTLGIRILLMEGGEPFLWKDGQYTLQDVVNEGKKYFYSVGVTTNGTLPLELESSTLWVSIDGLEETHNRIRNNNIFKTVLQHIEKSTHPHLFANTTISRVNYKEIPDLIRFLADKVKGITFQFYYPYDKNDEFYLPFDERRKVLDEIIDLKQKGFPVANSFGGLMALKGTRWTKRCFDWMVASIEPDGEISQGCYVKNRGQVQCEVCGFSTHAELSLAYDLSISSIFIGRKIFNYTPTSS